jgi:hypothetical protein
MTTAAQGTRTSQADPIRVGHIEVGHKEAHTTHRLAARTDPVSFKLHCEFVRWRGVPKGGYTTFFNGVMVSNRSQHD